MFRRSRSSSWVAGLLALALLCGACEASDPLEAIRTQQAAGDFAGSLDPLRKLLEQNPNDPEANYLYGVGLLYTQEPSLALFPLHKAMDDPAWLIPAGMQIAQAGLLSNDFNEVVNATTRILEKHPEEVQALLFRAQARAHWRQDIEAGLADANRVLELQPDMLEVYEPKILALLALDRKAEAREALAEAGRKLETSEYPESVKAWHCATTAVFDAEASEPDAAREQFAACLEKYPTDPTVISNSLEFYGAHGEHERALEVLRAAHEKAPEERGFRVSYADALRNNGKPAEGEAVLRDATAADDPRVAASAWVDLARYRHSLSEHAAAAEAWDRAIALTREFGTPDPQLLFQYADALVVSGQPDRAMAVAEEIKVPAQQHLIRGRVAQERRQHAKALAEFTEAAKLWPNNAIARYYTALSAEHVGDFDRALEEYRYAIRTAVGATDARTRAARLLIAEGQLAQAYQVLFLEVAKAPLEAEGELLSMYLMARVANPKQLQDALVKLRQRDPARYVLALERGAKGASEVSGPGGALNLLRRAPGIDYTAPGSAPVLRAIVHYAHAAKKPEVSRAMVAKALTAHPRAAVFHELQGLQLELDGAPAEKVRAAYERAVELDPQNAGAIAGLGRLVLASDAVAAAALFERAALADPSDPAPKLAAARAMRAAGHPDEAVRRFEALLDQYPVEWEPAAELVALDLERGTVTARTLERAARAARFGGGLPALERMGEVHTRLGHEAEAAKLAERVRLLKERQAAGKASEAEPVSAEEPPSEG
jgi:Flp pilus assembly protein TadD